MHRFLAIWPDKAAVADLAAQTERLRDASPPWLRWQSPERWHVTIVFLGSREISQRRLTRVASKTADGIVPTPLRLVGSGHFGPVLWIGVDSGTWLRALARDLSRGLMPESRPERFRPHVTVARARNRPLPPHQTEALGGYAGPAWQPTDLTLVASTVGPQPRYEILERYPFGG